MKKTLGIILVSTTFLLTSCSDEEFYEKEILESSESTNSPIDDSLSDSTGDSPTNDTNSVDEDSTNDNGTNDDTNDGSNTTVYIDAQDSFTQQEGNNKIDILWVIDNSGSMGNEQAALAQNFEFFIEDFINKNVDFKMAITTTDDKLVADSLNELTSEKLLENEDKFKSNFKEMIKVGTNGSGQERGLWAAEKFTNGYAESFFRSDAYYIVVYVSDEADQSVETTDHYLQNLKEWKDTESLVRAYSIVNMDTTASTNKYIEVGFERYKAMADNTNGYAVDIKNDFFQTLLTMGEDIAQLSLSFVLSETVTQINSVEVIVDGVTVTAGWIFDPLSNAVVFEEGSSPSSGADIKVNYKVEQ